MNKCPLCTNSIICKGLCDLHYRRFKRWGDPFYNNNDWLRDNRGVCNINNCSNIHKSLGLCQSHYDKKRDEDNPNYNKKRAKKWRKDNLERERQKGREYYHKNKKKRRKSNRNWRRGNPEILLKNSIKYLTKIGKIFDMNSSEIQYALQSWSLVVRKLDNQMCKNCDSIKDLHAHHIYPKSEFPEKALDRDNGVTLCEDCHSEIHGFKIY